MSVDVIGVTLGQPAWSVVEQYVKANTTVPLADGAELSSGEASPEPSTSWLRIHWATLGDWSALSPSLHPIFLLNVTQQHVPPAPWLSKFADELQASTVEASDLKRGPHSIHPSISLTFKWKIASFFSWLDLTIWGNKIKVTLTQHYGLVLIFALCKWN